MPSQSGQSNHVSKFKFNSRLDESRRRRVEVTVELRKQKKDEQIFKRRNIATVDCLASSEKPSKEMSIDEIIHGMESNDVNMIFEATHACRKMLSHQDNPPIDIMIKKGVVPKCVEFLNLDDHPNLQFESAWALTNIASGNTMQTKAVINNNGVPALIRLLKSKHMHITEQVVWALGNIAGDGDEARKIIFEYNPMETLVSFCNADASVSLIKNVVWTISNLCRGKTSDRLDCVKPALNLLRDLLTCHDKSIIADTCWAWSYLTDGTAEKIQMCVDSKVVPYLTQMLESNDTSILVPTLRALGNIVTGNDSQTDVVIKSGILKHLAKLLHHNRRSLVKESAWVISNITAGNVNQIQSVLDADLLTPLLSVLQTDDLRSQKEAAFAIMNITSGGTTDQIWSVVTTGDVIVSFCKLLDYSDDTKLLKVALETLINFMNIAKKKSELYHMTVLIESCGGLDKIELLQAHENEKIYSLAVKIIEDFFDAEVDNDDMMPFQNNGQFGFRTVDENTTNKEFHF